MSRVQLLILTASVILVDVNDTTAQQQASGQPTSADVVKRLVARSNQVFSGHFQYDFREVSEDQRFLSTIVFSGPSFRVYSEAGALMSHGDRSINYTVTRQPDGRNRHTAQIGLPQPMMPTFRDRIITGGWWSEKMESFLKAHTKNGQYSGSIEVAGVQCDQWDWRVEAKDRDAFDGYTDLTEGGGILRVCCAPQLGYVIPRIDKIGMKGDLAGRFECRDYREDAPGIYLPRVVSAVNFSSKGRLAEFQYTIVSVEKVNATIPDSDFRVHMPYGTEVMDSRPGRQNWYVLMEDLPLNTTGISNAITVSREASFFRRNWVSAVLIGALAGAAAVLFGRWLKRRSRRLRGN